MDFFSRDYISALRGCCALKFLHVLDSPRLASAHPKWGGGPAKSFNRENLKLALKVSLLDSITSGLVGLSSRNFFSRRAARQLGDKMVQILKGPPPKIREGKNRPKIFAIFDNFRL